MRVKSAVKAALYAGVLGVFLFNCGNGIPGGVGDDGDMSLFDGLLALGPDISYHQGPIPTGTADFFEDVQMNSILMSGGSMNITVRSNEELNLLYISFGVEPGYYEVDLSAYRLGLIDGAYTYNPTLDVSQASTFLQNDDDLRLSLVGVSSRGERSRPEDKRVQTLVVGSGLLQLSLSWNTLSDVDLHVVLPNGHHIYYGNRTEYGSSYSDKLVELDYDSNVGCADEGAVENMYFNALEDGLYFVYLHLYSSCGGAEFNVTARTNGVTLGNTYLNNTRGNFSSGSTQKIGVITVRNGNIVPTNYNDPEVISKMSTLRKTLEDSEKAVKTITRR